MGRNQLHDTTDDYVQLDVRWLQRKGFLRSGWSGTVNWSRGGDRFAFINISAFDGAITLMYKTRRGTGEWQNMNYPVSLEWIPCRFGGNRPWFRCPVCDSRAAILYGSEIFACRSCLRLSYQSQREAPHYRALSKAQALHEKLGGSGMVDDPIIKPKGMHWRTFRLGLQRFQEAESRAIAPWLLLGKFARG